MPILRSSRQIGEGITQPEDFPKGGDVVFFLETATVGGGAILTEKEDRRQ